jgi:tetratricopeptide (TPR) repeat protein
MSSSIRSRSEWWRLSVLLCALWALVPRPAVGAELTDEAKAQARVKFGEGNAAYAQGQYREALTAFEAAYQLAPLPGFLFNVAQCHRQLGHFTQAASAYRRFLSLSEKEPTNAAMVKELIAEMDSQAKQQTTSRARPGKPVAHAQAVPRDRPEAAPARPGESRDGTKKGAGGLKEPAKKPLDIQGSRELSAEQQTLPPAAMPGGAPVQEAREPLTRKWWVWAGAGAVAVVAGGVIYAVTAPEPRPTTLGTIPGR